MKSERLRESVGLPARPFLYTLDQIATLLSVNEATVRSQYIHFVNVDGGIPPKGRMQANNISSRIVVPDWRVTEVELVRWLRFKGFRLYETETS